MPRRSLFRTRTISCMFIATIILMPGCGAEAPVAATAKAVSSPIPTATPTSKPQRELALESPTAQSSNGVIPASDMRQHVGERLTVRGQVKWCQTDMNGTRFYSFDQQGTTGFRISETEGGAFTKQQLTQYCRTVKVTGTIGAEGKRAIIDVDSPYQVATIG